MKRPTPPERTEQDALHFSGDQLVVACISDTHSEPHPAALEQVAAHAPHAILHLGDIGDLRVLRPFAEVAPLYAVRGNIDTKVAAEAPDHRVLRVHRDDQLLTTWLLTHIAVRGPKLRGPTLRMAQFVGAQLVVCGHSHVPFIGMDRGVAVFNPGSIGPRRFRLPICYGLITLDASGLRFRHIDCETGQDWQP